jgi:hypothetical protein
MMGMNPRLLRPTASGRYGALRVGLVAYWPFEEDASSGDVTAVDWTGRGNDLTSNNTVPSVAGKIGSAREVVAANSEYLSRNSNADLQFGDGDWSISFWIFPTATGTVDGCVIGKDQSGGREVFFIAQTNTATNANRIAATLFHTDGTSMGVNGPLGANADFINRWHHAVVTHASGLVTLYFNGTSSSTANRAAGKALAATGTPFNVGRRTFSGFPNHLDAVVDELAKWSRALSAAEVSALWNNGTGIDLRR